MLTEEQTAAFLRHAEALLRECNALRYAHKELMEESSKNSHIDGCAFVECGVCDCGFVFQVSRIPTGEWPQGGVDVFRHREQLAKLLEVQP